MSNFVNRNTLKSMMKTNKKKKNVRDPTLELSEVSSMMTRQTEISKTSKKDELGGQS